MLVACVSPASLPETSRFAPAELVEPHVPAGEPVTPSHGTRVTLDELLVYADTNSPAIQAARSRVGISKAGVIGADINFPANPQISFGAGTRTDGDESGFEFEAAIQQQLEVAGEPGLRLDAAREQQRLSEAAVNEVRWSVHVEVHRLFVDILLAEERLAQAERFVAFVRSMRDITARQIEAGESAPLDLLVADADLAQTSEAVIEARRIRDALRVRLASVAGWPRGSTLLLSGSLPEVTAAPDTDTLLGSMAKHHPSVRTREIAVELSRKRLALESREAWPEPILGFGFGREAGLGSEPATQSWMISLALPLPIWRTNQEGRARAEARLDVADREREVTATRLHGELIEATISLNAAAERVRLYETGVVPQLEENLSRLQQAYELGEIDVHQVSQTRERLLTVTGQYIDARVTYFETAATLEGLVGTKIWSEKEENQ